MSQYVAITKIEYVPLSGNADEEVVPGNIGALRFGLEALQKEDASDFVRANQLWELMKKELADESEDETGAGATGSVQVIDEFNMQGMATDPYYG